MKEKELHIQKGHKGDQFFVVETGTYKGQNGLVKKIVKLFYSIAKCEAYIKKVRKA